MISQHKPRHKVPFNLHETFATSGRWSPCQSLLKQQLELKFARLLDHSAAINMIYSAALAGHESLVSLPPWRPNTDTTLHSLLALFHTKQRQRCCNNNEVRSYLACKYDASIIVYSSDTSTFELIRSFFFSWRFRLKISIAYDFYTALHAVSSLYHQRVKLLGFRLHFGHSLKHLHHALEAGQ